MMAFGTIATNILVCIIMSVLSSGAPDTMALASGWTIFLGPIMLLFGFILFIVAIVRRKRV